MGVLAWCSGAARVVLLAAGSPTLVGLLAEVVPSFGAPVRIVTR
jgi:hypothetical protein